MSSSRLLILGMVRIFGPIHGYDLRRQLVAMDADQWANIAFGSIYFGLGRLAEQGFLEAVETAQQGRRPYHTTYRITEKGDAEYDRLLRAQWWDVSPHPDPFILAITLMHDMPRDDLLAALTHRLQRTRDEMRAIELGVDVRGAPRHVHEIFRLRMARCRGDEAWLEDVIGKVERGELP
jgi:DNA-binding PadR family transcriptional regulator